MNQVGINAIPSKLCPKCQQIQKLTDFYKNKNRKDGLDCYCKICQNVKSKVWQLNNPDKVKQASQRWSKQNPEKRKQSSQKWQSNNVEQYREIKKSWRLNNSDKVKIHNQTFYEKNSETIKNRVKEWRCNNREKYREQRRTALRDPIKRLVDNQRSRIRGILSRSCLKKNQRTLKYIGCTADELKKHLEQQFTAEMTWENHGKFGWHVDHIQPLAKFDLNDSEQVKIAFWYTNLQPLWWSDNLKKRDN